MKLSKLIKTLQKVLDEEGDLDTFTAKDDEMNGFNAICFDPTVFRGEFEGKKLEGVIGLDEDEEDYGHLKKIVVI